MQEKNIFRTAIIAALLGLTFLFFYSGEADLQAVERIDSAIPEETVNLKGTVNRVSVSDKVIFLEIEGERVEKTDVILFTDQEIFVKPGDHVEISGTVEEYQGKKEVIANRILLK